MGIFVAICAVTAVTCWFIYHKSKSKNNKRIPWLLPNESYFSLKKTIWGIKLARITATVVDSIFGKKTFRRALWKYAEISNPRMNPDYFKYDTFKKELEEQVGMKMNFVEYENLVKKKHEHSRSGGCEKLLRELLSCLDERKTTLVIPYRIQKEQIQRWMTNRIHLNDYILKNPSVLDIPIKKPLIVTGLWRTGTTMLQTLLAMDPKCRAPRLWEIQRPIPPPIKETYESDGRINLVAGEISAIDILTANEHKHIHDLNSNVPEECAFIFFMDALVFNHLLNDRLPDYTDYIWDGHDMRGSYYFHKHFLQVLSSTYPPESHFILKSPYPHLYNLGALLEVYPDASIVVCHRQPTRCVPSMMSLNKAFAGAFWKDFDPKKTGHLTLDVIVDGAMRAMKFREELPKEINEKQFFDCSFEAFITDPIAMVKKIYNHFGYPITDEFVERMEKHLKQKNEEHRSNHSYKAESFGLSNEEVKEKFKSYTQKYYPDLV